MAKCPGIELADFDRLRNATLDQVDRGFRPLATRLRMFLNQESVVRQLQTHRSTWKSPRDPEAFQNFKPEPEHWYTFNHGGRSEAQLNIGMYPERLRIGLGFEFTEREYGNPKEIRLAFVAFLQAIAGAPTLFDDLVDTVPLEMELYPGRGGALSLIPQSSVADTLIDLPREPSWIFVGRMLYRDTDGPLLANGEELGYEIDRVFSALLPWWKAANTGGRPR